MTNSWWCQQQIEKLGLETYEDGDAIHLRYILYPEPLDLKEEKRLFMLLFEKYGIEIRAQYQNDGFWGTGMRNDYPGQNDMALPQGTEFYEYLKRRGEEPSVDTWPRMYTEAWLNH